MTPLHPVLHRAAGLVRPAGRCLNLAARASGYLAAASAWTAFAADRRARPFVKAAAATGLAVVRVHPVVNVSLVAIGFTSWPDRALDRAEAIWSRRR
jgi:hypothetical protein